MAKNFDEHPKQDFSKLVISLNQSKIIQNNPSLYQTILFLIRNTGLTRDELYKWLDELEEEIEAISGGSSDSADYVVLSDGAVDVTPQPIHNGAGQFIYTAYNP